VVDQAEVALQVVDQVVAQKVLAQKVLAQKVLAQKVLAQKVLAQKVLAQKVLAQKVQVVQDLKVDLDHLVHQQVAQLQEHPILENQ
jgi:hypothetical protein